MPEHVVYREFVQETVILNLETGTYHGLNPTGGKMLQTLSNAPTVKEAAATLATIAVPTPSEGAPSWVLQTSATSGQASAVAAGPGRGKGGPGGLLPPFPLPA